MFGFIIIVDKAVWSPRYVKAEVSSINTSSERITFCIVPSSYDDGSVIKKQTNKQTTNTRIFGRFTV